MALLNVSTVKSLLKVLRRSVHSRKCILVCSRMFLLSRNHKSFFNHLLFDNYLSKTVNFSYNFLTKFSTSETSTITTMTENKSPLLERARSIVPHLETERHKGQAGRIGIVGGSLEYTGAPYFAAISALKVGADLVHVFCPQAAAPVIKSYSPELIVHPLLDCNNALIQIEPWLERLHVLVIGPGLGRDRAILQTVSDLIRFCRQLQKPLIIDADGLFLINQDISLVKDYYGVILTPNAIEFCRLFGNDRANITYSMEKLGHGVTVLEKGLNDRIYDALTFERYECPLGGSARRCGGQGDLLSGALAAFYYWALESKQESNPSLVACFAACYLTKNCNKYAYKLKGRSMICTDMIEQIHNVFDDIFERKKE